MQVVTMYKSDTSGKVYESQKDAEDDERKNELVIFLEDISDIYWRSTNSTEVAEFLIKNRNRIIELLG